MIISIESLGWFTHNSRDDVKSIKMTASNDAFILGSEGGTVAFADELTNSDKFDYISTNEGKTIDISDENSNKLELFVTVDTTEIKWMMNSESNMQNVENSSEGIHPGSKGMLSFYIIPKNNGSINIHFSLDTALYDQEGNKIQDKRIKYLINGHILFLENVQTIHTQV